MSKMSELSMILKNLIECGNALVHTASALKDFYSSAEDEKEETKQEPVPDAEPTKTYSLEDVRAVLSAKSKEGFRQQVKDLITKHGAENLTKVDPAEYGALVAEVEVLGNV